MGKLLKIDKEIRDYLKTFVKTKYNEMRYEIEQYIKNRTTFKDLSEESQQILRNTGIYYKKTLPPDWED